MHGSDTTHPAVTTPSPSQEMAHRENTARLMIVRETGSLGHGIYAIANNCANEGHASLEDVEHIVHLARQLCRKIEQLGIALSN